MLINKASGSNWTGVVVANENEPGWGLQHKMRIVPPALNPEQGLEAAEAVMALRQRKPMRFPPQPPKEGGVQVEEQEAQRSPHIHRTRVTADTTGRTLYTQTRVSYLLVREIRKRARRTTSPQPRDARPAR